MNRPVIIESVFYFLLLLGLMTRNGDVLALTIPFAVYLGAGIFYGPKELRLKVTRILPENRVAVGRQAVIRINLTNSGDDLEEVLVEDMCPKGLDLAGKTPNLLTLLPAGGKAELEYSVKGTRGSFSFKGVRIIASDHLGIVRQRMVLSAPKELVFLPEIPKLQRVNIRPRQTHGYAGPILSRQAGSGLDFFGVREYQSGDPRNRINWKLSERHIRRIYTNDFEKERIADIVLILDARMSSEIRFSDESLFEYAIRATASLADGFLTDGNRVGLLIYGFDPKWTFPGYGRLHKKRIEKALLQAKTEEAGLFEHMDRLPIRRFPARSQVVMINPLLRDDTSIFTRLKKYGFEILVISPDPIDFEKKMITSSDNPGILKDIQVAARIAELERELRIKKLRKMGIRIVNWQIDTSLDRAIHSTMGRFPHTSHHVRLESSS